MFESADRPVFIIIAAGIIVLILLLRTLKRFKRINADFDNRIVLNEKQLSGDQIAIKRELGNPLEIRHQDSINNIISMWVYPDKIISFNQDGTLRKKIK